jgi:acyl-CoA thioesterase FadM
MGFVFYPTYFAWLDHPTHHLSSPRPVERCSNGSRTMGSPSRSWNGGRFRTPVFADDELEVVSSVEDVDARSFRMDHQIERNLELVASGFEQRAACTNARR